MEITDMNEEEIILNNIGLVKKIINTKFYNFAKINDAYDDILQEGYIALVKAKRNYKVDGNAQFSTYASRAVQNEICKYIKYYKSKNKDCIYLEEELGNGELTSDSNNKKIHDIIKTTDDYDNIFGSEIIEYIKKYENDDVKDIIKMLIDGKTQTEIAKIKGVTKSNINSKVTKLRKRLQENFNINLYDIKTNGKVLAIADDCEYEYNSVKECANALNIEQCTVRRICQNKKYFNSAYSSNMDKRFKFKWNG